MRFKFFEWSKETGRVYDGRRVYDGHFVKTLQAIYLGPWAS